jgi:hypothetical protein
MVKIGSEEGPGREEGQGASFPQFSDVQATIVLPLIGLGSLARPKQQKNKRPIDPLVYASYTVKVSLLSV